MSQSLPEDCSTEQYDVPKLLFNQKTHFDSRQRYYIVVALSRRKQVKIMEAVGQVHSHDQPFPTWSLVSQALSKALFAGPSRLQLKSTMELHQKDYLLFEQDFESGFVNTSSNATVIDCTFEVDFGEQLDRITWLGYWKPARTVVAGLVQQCWYKMICILHHLLLT